MEIPINTTADVIRIIDGDTIVISASIWPGITAKSAVRLRGVDTPELRGKCDSERKHAKKAKNALAYLVGQRVFLNNVVLGKYAGRVVASIKTAKNVDLATFLIDSGLGRQYNGKTKRKGWCD